MIMQPMHPKSLTQAGARVLSEWQPVTAGKKNRKYFTDTYFTYRYTKIS